MRQKGCTALFSFLPSQLLLLVLAAAAVVVVDAQSCASPSILYSDGFCGIRMNTSSDFRTIWTIGYPVVELQPGTYMDAARFENITANVTAAGFAATYIYAKAPNTVTWKSSQLTGIPLFTINAGFNLTLENITLDTRSGANNLVCTGSNAIMQLRDVTVQGYAGRNSAPTTDAITIANGCGLVQLGTLTFGTKSTEIDRACNSLIRLSDANTTSTRISGTQIYFKAATCDYSFYVTFSTKPTQAWAWSVGDIYIEGGALVQTYGTSSDLGLYFSKAIVTIKSLRTTTGGGALYLSDASVTVTDTYSRADSYYPRWIWGKLDTSSVLTFASTIKTFYVNGQNNAMVMSGGCTVNLDASNAVISNSLQRVFTLDSGSILSITGSNVTFLANSAAFKTTSTVIPSYYTPGFGGVIQASTASYVYITGSNITFQGSCANSGGGAAIGINASMLNISSSSSGGGGIAFTENVARSLVLWYTFDGATNQSMLLDSMLSRSYYALSNPSAASSAAMVDAANVARGSSSIAFPSQGRYVDLPTSVFNPYSFIPFNGITFSLWFRMVANSSMSNARILEMSDGVSNVAYIARSGSTNDIQFTSTNTGLNTGVTPGTSQYVTTTGTAVNSQFHHVVWSIATNGAWSIYLDNVQLVGPTLPTSISRSLNTVRYSAISLFRSTYGTSAWGVGNVDDLRVYSRVLTASEVSLLYTTPDEQTLMQTSLYTDYASSHGGVISLINGGILLASGVSFTNNYAMGSGGAIYVDRFSNASQIASARFTGNTAFSSGGGIFQEIGYQASGISNVVATGNAALYGDGGFLAANGTCYLYASSTWTNVTCNSNTARNGRGGCIFVQNDETRTMIPYEIAIVNPSYDAGNSANQYNVIYAADPWIRITGSLRLQNASDAFLTGISSSSCNPGNASTKYPCTLTNYYTGDANPSFVVGRCTSNPGTALDPYNNTCAKFYTWQDNLKAIVTSKTVSNFLLMPGIYGYAAQHCGMSFSSQGGTIIRANFTGLGHFSASGQLLDNRDSAMFDCQDADKVLTSAVTFFTFTTQFSARVTGIGFSRSFRPLDCQGCALEMENVQVQYSLGASQAIRIIPINSVNPSVVSRGYVLVKTNRAYNGHTFQISSLDTSKSDLGGTIWNVDSFPASASGNAGLYIDCATATSSAALKYNVVNTTFTNFRVNSGTVRMGYGLRLGTSCSIPSMQNIYVAQSTMMLAAVYLEGTAGINMTFTGSITMNGVTSTDAVVQLSTSSNYFNLANGVPVTITGGSSSFQTLFLLSGGSGSKLSASISNLQWSGQATTYSGYSSLVTMSGSSNAGSYILWNCTSCSVSNITDANSGGLFSIPAGATLDFTGANSTYAGVTSAGSGGIFYVSGASSKLSISGTNITFASSSSTNKTAAAAAGGGIIFAGSGASVTVSGSSISFVSSSSSGGGGGGAILATSQAAVTLTATTNLLFQGNQALGGGAIALLDRSSLNLTASSNATFLQNYATSQGGAIYADSTSWMVLSASSETNLSDAVEFVNNTAEQSGGAIYEVMSSSSLNLTNVVASGNRANSGNGGFLALARGSSASYASSWWKGLVCNSGGSSSNAAPQGSGGCISVTNNETLYPAPYEINILASSLSSSAASSSSSSSGNIISGGSWIYIEGRVTLASASDFAIPNTKYCLSGYPCTISDFYSGDPSPQYNGTYGVRCAVGTFYNTDTRTCQACAQPSLFYATAPGRTTCRACEVDTLCPCAPGTYTLFNYSCAACSAGSYSTSYASPSCTPCAAGTFSNTTASTFCSSCSAGMFVGVSGGTACLNCPAGSFSNASASATCQACTGGKYQPSQGTTTCLSCPAGYASTQPA